MNELSTSFRYLSASFLAVLITIDALLIRRRLGIASNAAVVLTVEHRVVGRRAAISPPGNAQIRHQTYSRRSTAHRIGPLYSRRGIYVAFQMPSIASGHKSANDRHQIKRSSTSQIRTYLLARLLRDAAIFETQVPYKGQKYAQNISIYNLALQYVVIWQRSSISFCANCNIHRRWHHRGVSSGEKKINVYAREGRLRDWRNASYSSPGVAAQAHARSECASGVASMEFASRRGS